MKIGGRDPRVLGATVSAGLGWGLGGAWFAGDSDLWLGGLWLAPGLASDSAATGWGWGFGRVIGLGCVQQGPRGRREWW